jgi:hypothetical protein
MRTWLENAERKAEFKELANLTALRATTVAQAFALNVWRGGCARLRRATRALAHWRLRAPAAALDTWRDAIDEGRARRQMVGAGAGRHRWRHLARAFGGWLDDGNNNNNNNNNDNNNKC